MGCDAYILLPFCHHRARKPPPFLCRFYRLRVSNPDTGLWGALLPQPNLLSQHPAPEHPHSSLSRVGLSVGDQESPPDAGRAQAEDASATPRFDSHLACP